MAKKRKLEASAGADRAEMLRLLDAAKLDGRDDGARLALADWLEEHGGESDKGRAEIIRLQLDTANGGPDCRLSIDRLREKWVREWVAPWRAFFREKLPTFERGLMVAEPRGHSWQREDAPPDEAWSWVETVRPMSYRMRALPALLGSPRLATVPCLDLASEQLSTVGLRTVRGTNTLGRQRRLRLMADGRLLDDIVRLLPTGLDTLDISLSNYDLRPLFNARCVEGLRSLAIGWCVQEDAGAAELAAAPGLRGLRELALTGTRFTAAGVAALAALPLRRLSLTNGDIGVGGVAALAGTPCGAVIEELRLRECGAKAVPPSLGPLPRLRRLALTRLDLRPPALAALASGGLMEGLDEIDLSDNHTLGADGAAALAAVKRGPRTLRLSLCLLGRDGVRRLAEWPGLAAVRHLDLSNNHFDDAGVRALIASPHTGSLSALNIGSNVAISPAAVLDLIRSPLGRRLSWLSVFGVYQTFDFARALIDAAPVALREFHAAWDAAADDMRRLRAALPNCAF